MKQLIKTNNISGKCMDIPTFEFVKYEIREMHSMLKHVTEVNVENDYSTLIPVYYAIYQMFKFQDKYSELPEIVKDRIKNIVLRSVDDDSEKKEFRKSISRQIEESIQDPAIYGKINEFIGKFNFIQ